MTLFSTLRIIIIINYESCVSGNTFYFVADLEFCNVQCCCMNIQFFGGDRYSSSAD